MSILPIPQLTSKEQIKLQSMFEESQLQNYFQSIKGSQGLHQDQSFLQSKIIIDSVKHMISDGNLCIENKRVNIDSLLQQRQISQEESKMLQLKAKRQQISRQLQYLQNGGSSEGADNLILSKQQHKKRMRKIVEMRKEKEKLHDQYMHLVERKEEQSILRQKAKIEKQKQEKQRKKEVIKQKLAKQKSQHQKFIQLEKQSNSKLKEVHKKKFLHQKIEESYHQKIVLPNLQEKKRRLKQIRDFNTLNLEQINLHEKSYLQKREMSLQKSRQSKIVNNQDYKPPPKSQKLEALLQQERMKKILDLEAKKNNLQQKIRRQEDFVTYLKDNFSPSIDPSKREQIQQRLKKLKSERIQTKDARAIGLNYLSIAKKKKKVIDRPETERNIMIDTTSESKSRAISNYLSENRHQKTHYEKNRRQNLQKIIKMEGLTEGERMQQLKIQAEVIGQNIRMKQKMLKYRSDDQLKEQTLELLLSSIQAKIGIIQMYK